MEISQTEFGPSRSAKSLMRGWRVLHASLAVFPVVAIGAHLCVSLRPGYGLLRLHRSP